jgi:predicted small lipoprotein YifL
MRKLMIGLTAAALLSACGLKGPLYLPSQKPGATPPKASTPAKPPEADPAGTAPASR